MIVIPTSITFGPDKEYGFFEIFVDQSFDYDDTSDIIITITESGTDAAVFEKPSNLILDIDNFYEEDTENPEDAAGMTVVSSTTGMNRGIITVTGDTDGVVYWYFGCEGVSYTYDTLKSKI